MFVIFSQYFYLIGWLIYSLSFVLNQLMDFGFYVIQKKLQILVICNTIKNKNLEHISRWIEITYGICFNDKLKEIFFIYNDRSTTNIYLYRKNWNCF